MAAVGQLAAGIIHEVGNPVAAISGAIDSIRRQQASSPGVTTANTGTAAENVDIIASQINRLADLTREISEFAAPPTAERHLLDLNQLVRSGVNLLRFDPRWRDIEVQLSLNHNVPAILGSADQLTQVLFNLLMNAADACENLTNRKPSIEVSTFPEKGHVCMTVADNGCGMDDDVKSHAFDPFFSTKAPGKGIGLGLGLCRNLIEEHGGRCQIETRAGAGTTIQVCLPVDGGAEESVS
jgi:C4-dicarboxylate-specific signal transduction histidine kinase